MLLHVVKGIDIERSQGVVHQERELQFQGMLPLQYQWRLIRFEVIVIVAAQGRRLGSHPMMMLFQTHMKALIDPILVNAKPQGEDTLQDVDRGLMMAATSRHQRKHC